MVNIEDIYEFEPETKLEYKKIMKQIFDKQKELLIKYREIENLPVTLNINSPEHQKLLKEFTFRGIEELAEAQEAVRERNMQHFLEEISDAIHFFTEVLIMANVDIIFLDDEIFDWAKGKELELRGIEERFWKITYFFSISCNKLKCKPWKKTQVLTDEESYKDALILAYNEMMKELIGIGFGGKQVLDIYMMKHNVNKFRIRSNY